MVLTDDETITDFASTYMQNYIPRLLTLETKYQQN